LVCTITVGLAVGDGARDALAVVPPAEHLVGDRGDLAGLERHLRQVTDDHLLALPLDDPVDGAGVGRPPLAAPAPGLDLQLLAPVGDLEEALRAREQVGGEVGQQPERVHLDVEVVDHLGELVDLVRGVELDLVADQHVDRAPGRGHLGDVRAQVEVLGDDHRLLRQPDARRDGGPAAVVLREQQAVLPPGLRVVVDLQREGRLPAVHRPVEEGQVGHGRPRSSVAARVLRGRPPFYPVRGGGRSTRGRRGPSCRPSVRSPTGRDPRERPTMDLDELERAAREQLTPMAYDYYAGGAGTETTVRDNRTAWDGFRLHPYVLRDVSTVSTRTRLLGTELATPVVVAPTAYQRLAHPDGELATARGAEAAGALVVVSTLATTSLEDVVAAAPDAPRWFQLYVFDDRGYAGELVDRAAAAGYRALVLTVDAPVLGYRPRDERNGFRLPDGLAMANVPREMPETDGSGLAALFGSIDRTLTVDDLAWLKERSGLPLVVKGVHRGDDAVRCLDAGADAVVVSNHGGRQLDSAVATADALPEVVDAVAGRAPSSSTAACGTARTC
jgi:4-hydroxymandelate oxidase